MSQAGGSRLGHPAGARDGKADEPVISTAPVIRGAGKRPFDGFDRDIDLEVVEVYRSPYATHAALPACLVPVRWPGCASCRSTISCWCSRTRAANLPPSAPKWRARAGSCNDPDDVFFLTLPEARQAAQCIRWSAARACVAVYLRLTEPGSTRT